MLGPRLTKIEIQGFRAFGQATQTLEFRSSIAVVWGPNSQGKTSFAEAFEFLLTGQICRRELTASGQDEFADALRNAHMPPGTEVFVQGSVIAPDGSAHTIRRRLNADYGKKQDCQSTLEIDGRVAAERDLADLGIVLSQPPLRAPVLTQHTLAYLFSARPQDRANYFRALLEVTDLEAFRNAVAALDPWAAPPDLPVLLQLGKAAAVPQANRLLSGFQTGSLVPTLPDITKALDAALVAVITATDGIVPTGIEGRIAALDDILAEKRAAAFPVRGFDKAPLGSWLPPAVAQFDKLGIYVTERDKVDEEVRRLTSLFKEALALPAVATAHTPIDCPLCAAPASLTPARIASIAARVADTESFRNAEKEAKDALGQLESSCQALAAQASAALPRFFVYPSKARRLKGFRLERISALLPDGEELTAPWLVALRTMARRYAQLAAAIRVLQAGLAPSRADIAALIDPGRLQWLFRVCSDTYSEFADALSAYLPREKAVAEQLKAVIDGESQTGGWQELIDLARNPAALRAALVQRAADAALQTELSHALKQIDRGNEIVLEEKFGDLSRGVQDWWELLRPDEYSFFSAVTPRPKARRTIDFKAGLAARADRSDAKLRDVIAVFSQSQLHCLGLALFIARAIHEGAGFLVLDDPILSSDEDYRCHFNASVVERLIEQGMQLIILTQDQKTWKDLENRYLHKSVTIFRIALENPLNGTVIHNTSDDLGVKLARIEVLARNGSPDLRKQACQELRDAAERFCKVMLVNYRWVHKEPKAAISDYDGKNLGELGPKTEALLVKDASHPGKLRALRDAMNPAKHDDGIPSQGALKVSLGDLKKLKQMYLG